MSKKQKDTDDRVQDAYLNGYRDGRETDGVWQDAFEIGKKAGACEVADRARALVEATRTAARENKGPDEWILFDATLDFLLKHCPPRDGGDK